MDLPFTLETTEELAIASEKEWRAGVEWGMPRPGHPEGAVKWHVAEVLANLDRLALSADERRRLRIAALVHDTFKRRVRWWARRRPPNEHGSIAARWLRRRLDDEPLATLVELHDEGFRAWRDHRAGREEESVRRIDAIVQRMGDEIGLFVAFYWADNRSGDKETEQVGWFVGRLAERGRTVPVLPEDGPGTGRR